MSFVTLVLAILTASAAPPFADDADGLVWTKAELAKDDAYLSIVKGEADRRTRKLFLTGLSALLMGNASTGETAIPDELRRELETGHLLHAVLVANRYYLHTGMLPPGVLSTVEPIRVKAREIQKKTPEGLTSLEVSVMLWSVPRSSRFTAYDPGFDLAPVLVVATPTDAPELRSLLMVLLSTRGSSSQGWSCNDRLDPVLGCELTLLTRLSELGELPPLHRRRLAELQPKPEPTASPPPPARQRPTSAAPGPMWNAERGAVEQLLVDSVGGGPWLDLGRMPNRILFRSPAHEVRVGFTNGQATWLTLSRNESGPVSRSAVDAFLSATAGTGTPIWTSETCGLAGDRTIYIEGTRDLPYMVTVSQESCD